MNKIRTFITKYDKLIGYLIYITIGLSIIYFVLNHSSFTEAIPIILNSIILYILFLITKPDHENLISVALTIAALQILAGLVIISCLHLYYVFGYKYTEKDIIQRSITCYELKEFNSNFELIGLNSDNQLTYLGNTHEGIGFKFLNNRTGYAQRETIVLKTWNNNTYIKYNLTYAETCNETYNK